MNLFTIIVIGIIIIWIIISIRYIYKNRDAGFLGDCSKCRNNCGHNRNR